MRLYKTLGQSFLFITLIFIGNSTISIAAKAEETIPIPPKRPNVLSVSPAYIEELRNRELTLAGKTNKEPDSYTTTQNNQPAETIDTQPTTLDAEQLVNILEPLQDNTLPSAPIPRYKPSLLDKNIEPAAQEKSQETTLVSFALKPRQVSLDKNLRYFLEKHAIRILTEDKSLEIQIHAYATPIEGESYSDVRISLARALEIRSFLIDKNIEPSRLKLTPVGHDKKNGSNDRIDLIFVTKE
ncbi:MAG: hypothetical protein COA45_02420 [Zetaproteobacteria bacterium]|nr:MAG: hypothetical protein COA45_02420 [Zetaproteobacteria bacterium]